MRWPVYHVQYYDDDAKMWTQALATFDKTKAERTVARYPKGRIETIAGPTKRKPKRITVASTKTETRI